MRLLFVHPDPPGKRGSVKWEISTLSGRPHSEAWQLGTPATMEVKKWTWSKVVYQSIKVVEDGHIPAQTNLMINGHAQWTIPRRKICQIPALQGPTIPSFSGRDKLRSTCSMLVSILICKSFAVDIRITCSKELAHMSSFTVRRSNGYFSAVTW